MRPIERSIEKSHENGSIDDKEQEQLQTLCNLIRSWRSRSLAHKYRLKGTELYESMNEIADAIPILRAKKDHEVLETIQKNLNKSISGLQIDYEALKQGQDLLHQLTDLLYGPTDDKSNRNTQAYKEQKQAKEVKQQVEQLLEQSEEQDKTHSCQMEDYLKHFQNTYQNWSPNLFTCYDYPDIPNDNNRLELSHSQIKKERRRTTGQQSTAKYLKLHGEQAAFTLNFGQGVDCQQAIIDLIQQTDAEQFKKEKLKQKQKSKERGKLIPTKKKLTKTIKDIILSWGEIYDSD